MPQYMLKPKVYTAEKRMLTHPQLMKMIRGLKSKKSGVKMLAYDVEEIVVEGPTILKSTLDNKDSVTLLAGYYYNVHFEYCIDT